VPETAHDHLRATTTFRERPHQQLIADAAADLASAGVDNAWLDAETMLARACHSSRTAVISGLSDIDGTARQRFAAMVTRRRQREPLSYILGCKEFYSLEFEVTPAVLIPRPETEAVVTTALEFIRDHPRARVCDIGTGSGAIALAIAANAPDVRVTATDISSEALSAALQNAVRLGLASRVLFRLADGFDPLDELGPLGRFDLLVSNPPYIREDEISALPAEISRYEPRVALAGGRDGLKLYRRIAARLVDHLGQYGSVIVEIGADQSDAVTAILRDLGALAIKVLHDLADLPRVVVADFG
jgi:release factor glutamine methyltransferase